MHSIWALSNPIQSVACSARDEISLKGNNPSNVSLIDQRICNCDR